MFLLYSGPWALSFGVRLLGYIFDYGLFGILTMQVFVYYLSFPKDKLRTKALVYSVFSLELAQTILVSISAENAFSSGNVFSFEAVGTTWIEGTLMSGFVGFIVECFYASRVKTLSKSRSVAALILFLAAVQLMGSIAVAIVLRNTVRFPLIRKVPYLVTVLIWSSSSALCDLLIAFSMTHHITKKGSQILNATNDPVRKAIRLVIETGTCIAAISIINLAAAVHPNWPAPYELASVILAKVYSNSMMAALNIRVLDRIEPRVAPLVFVNRDASHGSDGSDDTGRHDISGGGRSGQNGESWDVPESPVSTTYPE